jgi:hypothetical protein
MLGFNINTVCWLDHWTPHIVCASVSLEKPLLDETIFIVVVTCCVMFSYESNLESCDHVHF